MVARCFCINKTSSAETRRMKKINIIYWTSTILVWRVHAVLPRSPISWSVPEAVLISVSKQLGYPTLHHRIPRCGKKTWRVIAFLIRGFPRIKEWNYAGLFFDLVGATYSGIAVGGFDPLMLTMLPIFRQCCSSPMRTIIKSIGREKKNGFAAGELALSLVTVCSFAVIGI